MDMSGGRVFGSLNQVADHCKEDSVVACTGVDEVGVYEDLAVMRAFLE